MSRFRSEDGETAAEPAGSGHTLCLMAITGEHLRWRAAPRLSPGAAATAVALASVVCTGLAVSLHRRAQAAHPGQAKLALADIVLATAYPAVAAVILAHQPRNRVGWLLASTAFMGPYLLAGQYAAWTSMTGPRPLTTAATWVSLWGFWPYFVVWALVPMHFPDGRLASNRWRRLRAVVIALLAVGVVARMFAPVESDADAHLANPLALPHGGWLNVITLITSMLLVAGGAGLGVAAIWSRLRRATGVDRMRLQWLIAGVTALAVTGVVSAINPSVVGPAAMGIGMTLLVVAMAIGAARHQLFDIGTALSRTVVYGLLTSFLVIGYLATVAAAGAIASQRRIAYAAVALAALLAAAARDQVQHAIDRFLFGGRNDPYAVLSQMHEGLGLATGPIDALGQLADGVRKALKLPYIAIRPDDGRLEAIESGVAVEVALTLDVSDNGARNGALVIGHRHPSERFKRGERALFDDLALRAGALLSAAALSHDLERSREAVVVAREEERRRLRADLHDGLGPQLAAMAMQLESLTGRLPGQDMELVGRADRLRDQMRSAVAEIRHVVDDLRPPALDELGLAGALHELVSAYPSLVRMTVMGDDSELRAATEVAAYRIVAEAVTNAVRHANATRVTVTMRFDREWLTIEVVDDGDGFAPGSTPGTGLTSMSERAGEVGGRFTVTGNHPSGTVLRARLPR